MKNKDIKKLAEYWKNGSLIDFDSAKDICFNTKRYVNSLFFIHLSVEKALKYYFVTSCKEQAPYTHNLLSLARYSNLELTSEHQKLLAEINEFNLKCRYPDSKFEIYKKSTKTKTHNLLKKTEGFLKWILEK